MSWGELPDVVSSMIDRQLPERQRTLRTALESLLRLHEPEFTIVECGSMRDDDWIANGRSTLLFQEFISIFGGKVITVDLDPETCNFAASLTHPGLTSVVCRDATTFLKEENVGPIHLLYLDSVDVNFANPGFSASETRRHLDAAWDQLAPGAIILTDDTPHSTLFVPPWVSDEERSQTSFPTGKGALLLDYPGVQHMIHEYQLLMQRPFTTESIPRVIHYVFGLKGDSLPEKWKRWMQETMALNPDFACRMWDAADCDQLVKEYDPDFYETWQSIPDELFVVKADYIRVLIVLIHGGFYLDCDILPLAPLDPLVTPGIDCILFREGKQGIANAALAATANHPVMETALNAVREGIREHLLTNSNLKSHDIITWSGPHRIRHAAQLHGIPANVKGVPSRSMVYTGEHLLYAPNGVLLLPVEAMIAPGSTMNWFGTHCCDGTWRPRESDGQVTMDDQAIAWRKGDGS